MHKVNFITATSSEDIEDCFKIRKEVFIDEQNVPHEVERDSLDNKAIHYLLFIDNKPCATARIVLTDNNSGKSGRVAVIKNFRGKGFGKIIEDNKSKNIKKLVTHSQSYITDFYTKLGFKKEGKEFFEAEIPHYKMILEL